MKALCFALLALTIFASAYEVEEGVVVLTDSNFDESLREFEYALVEFYAPWCGHCKHLAPEYASAAQNLAETHPNVKLVKVDATVNSQLGSRFNIGGYPTLKFFSRGNSEPTEYNGGRTAAEIVNWLKRKTGPATSEVSTVVELQKQIISNDALAVFIGSAESAAFADYSKLANEIEDVAFLHTDSPAIKEEYGVTDNNLIIWANQGEEKKVYNQDFSIDNLRDFIHLNKIPTVLPFNQAAAQRIFGEGLDAIFLIVQQDQVGERATEVFKSVAAELKEKVVFSLAKLEEDFGGKLVEFLGIPHDQLPTVRIVQPGNNMKKFTMEGEISPANIRQFVADLEAGTLKAQYKSAAIPAQSHENGVRIVVGKNFEEVVLDPNSDVLVEFYAPWCGHCKSLAPTYERLATQLSGVEGLVIAKMDATENEHESVSVEGFPTIRFYPKNNKGSPLDYDDNREFEDFVNYLRRHSSANIPSSIGGSSHSHEHHDHDHDHHGHDHGHGHGDL